MVFLPGQVSGIRSLEIAGNCRQLLSRLRSSRQVAVGHVEIGISNVSIRVHGAVVFDIAPLIVSRLHPGAAIHHHEGAPAALFRLTIEVHAASVSGGDLVANDTLAIRDDIVAPVAVVPIPGATVVAVAAALIPAVTVPRTASAVPGDVAGVALHATTVVLDAHYRNAVVGIGIAHKRLPTASVDTLKSELIRPHRQWLVALQAHPLCGAATDRSHPSLVAANFYLGDAAGADLEGAFAAPAAARHLSLDRALGGSDRRQHRDNKETQ